MIRRWQCGSWRAAWAVSMLLAVPALAQEGRPSEAEQADKARKAEQVLEKWIEAQGGRAALEKIKNQVTRATIEVESAGIRGKVVTKQAQPNKQLVEATIGGAGTERQGSDGEIHWELSMMGPRILEGEEAEFARRHSVMHADLKWKELFEKAELAGEAEVEGSATWKVVLTPKSGPPVTQYFDKDTYLLRKFEMIAPVRGSAIPITHIVDDYRRVGDVLAPHKIKQNVANMVSATITVESIEHNVDLPEDTFALPPEIVELKRAKEQRKPATQEKPEGE